jgi:hypothetical protein
MSFIAASAPRSVAAADLGTCSLPAARDWGAVASRLIICALLSFFATTVAAQPRDYLPLAPGAVWHLRSPAVPSPVVLEVIAQPPGATTLRFRSPWATNLWRLVPRGSQVFLTGFATGERMLDLPDDTLFFDFARGAGTTWRNAIGRVEVVATGVTVAGRTTTYRDCIRLKHESGGGAYVYTFAPGVGLVQFGAADLTFVIDEEQSRAGASDSGPSASAPHRGAAGSPTAVNPPAGRHPLAPQARPAPLAKPNVGVTTNTLASEAETPQNLMRRFEQTLAAGISYISGAGLWTDFEPSKGRYDFQKLDFQVHHAARRDIPMSYTLRLIDTVNRALPPDLLKKRWNDPEMEDRVLQLVDAMVPRFKGRVQWFMFGNEIDGYFERNPGEIADFVQLFAKVRARVKALAPAVAVSTTLMFAGADMLGGTLQPVDELCDVLSFTYYPMRPDFTVQDPGIVTRDFARMREWARGRGVVLQEIGYPSSALNASSPAMQASFYSNVFSEMRVNRDLIEAGSFFLLGDLSDATTDNLAGYYGVGDVKVFKAFLQTLGMFDAAGRPKASWDVFSAELRR